MAAPRVFLSRFTPSRTAPDVLEKIFVQRGDLARDTEERLRESALSGNKHHLLFIGPRGSGKTHFVSLIFHRLAGRDELRDRLRIAWLGEDETTSSFSKFLLRIHRALEQQYPAAFSRPASDVLQKLDESGRGKFLARFLVEQLQGRTLLVIVENLDALFDGLGESGQKQWRAFMQENPVSATLATSQQLFEGVSRRTLPFYGFFQIEHFKPLSFDDTLQLLKNVASLNSDFDLIAFLETPSGRSRVRALHHLSGGNQRIDIILSDFVTRESLDTLVEPFEKLMDELTPYYQARLSWLSAQQREIVEFLCKCRYAVPVKEIADQLFISHQTATGQLKALKERGYVQGHAVGRESRYELAEPLMRLCVEIKENPGQPIRLIVDFLRVWHSPEQLAHRLQFLPLELSVERRYVQTALREFETTHDDPRLSYLLRDLQRCNEAGDRQQTLMVLEELAEIRGEATDWRRLGLARLQHGHLAEASLAYARAVELTPTDSGAWSVRSLILLQLGRHAEALACWDHVLGLEGDNESTWFGRGVILQLLGRHDEAVTAYERALQFNPEHVSASYSRVDSILAMRQWKRGFQVLEESLRRFPPAVHETAANVECILDTILRSTQRRSDWKPRLSRLFLLYSDARASSYLGVGLVRSLRLAAGSPLPAETLAAWHDVWREIGGEASELQVPLRIFDVGIRYLHSGDQRVLLDLVQEERQVLADALGLKME